MTTVQFGFGVSLSVNASTFVESIHMRNDLTNDRWEAAALDHIYPVPFDMGYWDCSGNMGITEPAGYMSYMDDDTSK